MASRKFRFLRANVLLWSGVALMATAMVASKVISFAAPPVSSKYQNKRPANNVGFPRAFGGQKFRLSDDVSKGRTKCTEVMFGPAGVTDVYLIDGMYDLLNLVTASIDFPAAILTRGIELTGSNANGPPTRIEGTERAVAWSSGHVAERSAPWPGTQPLDLAIA